jgi:hypothetical protein
MSYLLSNPSTKLLQTLSRESWSRILSLARFYGWQPMGTLPPYIYNLRGLAGNDGVWDGDYLRNEGQVVQGVDALAMAIALEMSLDDIPDVNPERETTLEDDLPEWLSPAEKALIRDGLVDHEYNVSAILPFEYFAGDAKQNLTEFIRFCMLGEFVIS